MSINSQEISVENPKALSVFL